jgi:formylglycine-generating enzyme required for sulfatase activity/tRNA A-37 threonylcarbamoyl transferase component Bud32
MENSFSDEPTVNPAPKAGGHVYALKPGEVLGQYKIIKALGAGGMGEVYLVENIQMHKRYALKVLPRSLSRDPQFIGRFKVEARVMADLSHPHIVGVHTMGEERGLYYLVMDYIAGPDGEPQTLEDVLRDQSGHLKPEQVKDIALQICDALEYAHGFRDGVIHRDLKPANILMSSTEYEIRIADFGLAKVVGESYLKSVIERSISLSIGGQIGDTISDDLTDPHAGRPHYQKTSTRSILGTYDYMSPEQKVGLPVSPASDVYALGMMLYLMLTGKKAEGRFKLPSAYGCHKSWDAIIERCLQTAPQDRYPTITALKADVAKVGRAGSRRAWWAWAAGLLVLAGVGGFMLPTDREGEAEPVATAVVPVVVPEVPERVAPAAPQEESEATAPVTFRFTPGGLRVTVHGDHGLVGQADVGDDGIYRLDLPPGRYEVFAQKDGYELQPDTFTMGAEPLERPIALVALRGGVTVTTVAEATVQAQRVGEQRVENLGTANAAGSLNYNRLVEGHYDLLIHHPDYVGRTNRVEIRKDRPAAVDGRLQGRPGRLFIVASPRAEVWVDGERTGHTGTELSGLAPGNRQIEVQLAGYRTERRTVNIPPNRAAPRWNVGNLSRESGSIRVLAEVSPAAARDHFQTVAKEVTVRAQGARGTARPVAVTSLPWTTSTDLPCEPHEVELEVAGYEVSRRDAAAPVVRDGQTTTVTFAVSPKPSRIRINSNASGARVYDAADDLLGDAGAELTLASFVAHTLTVRADGYADGTTSFTLNQPDTTFRPRQVTLEERRGPTIGQNWRSPETGMEFVWIAQMEMWVGKFEVTNEEYRKKEPRHNSGEFGGHPLNGNRQPVVQVNFDEAKAYADWLTNQDREVLGGMRYRLPSNDEWQRFAQVGDGREYPWGNQWPPPSGMGLNYHGQEGAGTWGKIAGYRDDFPVTAPVDDLRPNPWGLYGVGGNVWEACASDSTGGSFGAWRGASWRSNGQGSLRCSYRIDFDGSVVSTMAGFVWCCLGEGLIMNLYTLIFWRRMALLTREAGRKYFFERGIS